MHEHAIRDKECIGGDMDDIVQCIYIYISNQHDNKVILELTKF